MVEEPLLKRNAWHDIAQTRTRDCVRTGFPCLGRIEMRTPEQRKIPITTQAGVRGDLNSATSQARQAGVPGDLNSATSDNKTGSWYQETSEGRTSPVRIYHQRCAFEPDTWEF